MMRKAAVFDFGGVLAEEGFREGLLSIARKNGFDPPGFFNTCEELIFRTGYLFGNASEETYWAAVRNAFPVSGTDAELREEILERFILRDLVLEWVIKLRNARITTAILSDQTNWLEELDSRNPFFGLFDRVFNSYRIRKSKRDPSVFSDVCAELNVEPHATLFIDDNKGHTQRAAEMGLKTIHFVSEEDFTRKMKLFFPEVPDPMNSGLS